MVDRVVTVMVELPVPITETGLNEAVAPDGNPLALKLTEPLKPFKEVTVAL